MGSTEPDGSGTLPRRWIVTWGALLRPGFAVESVCAFDRDDALVVAALARPDLERPRVAFLASGEADQTEGPEPRR